MRVTCRKEICVRMCVCARVRTGVASVRMSPLDSFGSCTTGLLDDGADTLAGKASVMVTTAGT